ncbi:peptide/nickel transport system substrate-binding protein [Frankia sp. AiPs1]|uniref:ABC transporter substrate-binding protein n=1 Tax=Frankia sp. AiPa1 TaxID=573492 RepID=UPI00202B2413|nr:ABC transporter substrate-binding protein [Frankia sp. AiPa1]MCL9760549.1 ABC transporter substrate-binding protein [Frankia sp. AiPa1]
MPTRRNFLALSASSVAVLGLGTAGLAACADDSSSPAAGGTGTPHSGGSIILATTAEPDSWDLHVSVSTLSALTLRAVYDSLVHQKRDGSVEPWLATSWKISADGRSYTFVLRDDVTFHDGTPFNAEAVKVNLDHVVAPATKSRNAKTLLGPYQGTDVVDEHTVVIRLSSPYSPLLSGLASPYLGFHSPTVLRTRASEIAAGGRALVSTGPFVFTQLTPGQQAVFTRRKGYRWAPKSVRDQGDAYLDRYTVQFLTDDAARVGALTSGQLDVADQIPATRLAQLRGQPGITLVSRDQIGAPFTYALNTSRAPFNDRNVRLAVQSGVDVRSITKGLFQGAYSNGWSALSSSTPGYDRSVENTWKYDQNKALSLLAKAGYTATDSAGYRTRDGQRLRATLAYAAEYTTEEQKNYHTALKDALKQIGLEVVLRPLATAQIIATLASGDYDLGAGAANATDASILRTLFYSSKLPGDGGANTTRIRDTEIDGWLDQALRSQNTAEQNVLYGKVQRKVIAEAYILPTFVGKRTYGLRSRVSGFALDADNLPRLADVWVG